jgi:hypothetical protein
MRNLFYLKKIKLTTEKCTIPLPVILAFEQLFTGTASRKFLPSLFFEYGLAFVKEACKK